VTVGIVANPASGRDIRRLVSGASVFDNSEKGSMVYRLMVGLAAAGVGKVLMMPAASGVGDSLRHHLRGNTGRRRQHLPELEILEMRVRGDARDTGEAIRLMRGRGVTAIAVLGGDGTCRVASSHCYDTPLCALSTGTNNAFPVMREATVAGIATGLVAVGALGEGVIRCEKVLHVSVNGANGEPEYDRALVDVAVCRERWIGARALYEPEAVSAIFTASASPDSIGLSAVAGQISPVSRDEPRGLFVELTDPAKADTVLSVPLAPGMVSTVGVARHRRLEPGETVKLSPGGGSLALDGEREIELGPGSEVEISISPDGPLTIDVEECMKRASRKGLLGGVGSAAI
jgi:predicted polyphosphate/ATP-dependent NAD kinase